MLDFQDNWVEDFIGFYSAEGFWVDERIDLFDEENSRRLVGIVPEISVRMDSEKFSAAVCVDGLMLLRIKHLAANMPSGLYERNARKAKPFGRQITGGSPIRYSELDTRRASGPSTNGGRVVWMVELDRLVRALDHNRPRQVRKSCC